jgi:hypothetical protein
LHICEQQFQVEDQIMGFKLVAFLMTIALLPTFAAPQRRQREKKEDKPASERTAAASRSFEELFGKLERGLMDSAAQNDRAALDATLATEFTYRGSSYPEKITTRTEWIEKMLKNSKENSARLREMKIRAYGGGQCQASAIVSFVQLLRSRGKNKGRTYLVVDVWQGTPLGVWQLAQRYKSFTSADLSESE